MTPSSLQGLSHEPPDRKPTKAGSFLNAKRYINILACIVLLEGLALSLTLPAYLPPEQVTTYQFKPVLEVSAIPSPLEVTPIEPKLAPSLITPKSAAIRSQHTVTALETGVGARNGGVVDEIRQAFGPYADQAISVAQCESNLGSDPKMNAGSYKGVFQMGANERATYGEGVQGAANYFAASGHTWGRWSCKP